MTTRTKTYGTICPGCGRFRRIGRDEHNMFGADSWCVKCCDNRHVEFMRTTGRKLKLSCSVAGCPCKGGAI